MCYCSACSWFLQKNHKYLLSLNKQLYEKEAAGPALTTEGFPPRGNSSFLSGLTASQVGAVEDVWKLTQPKSNVIKYRFSTVKPNPLKDLFLPSLSSGAVLYSS